MVNVICHLLLIPWRQLWMKYLSQIGRKQFHRLIILYVYMYDCYIGLVRLCSSSGHARIKVVIGDLIKFFIEKL